jgi:hypothetical protein
LFRTAHESPAQLLRNNDDFSIGIPSETPIVNESKRHSSRFFHTVGVVSSPTIEKSEAAVSGTDSSSILDLTKRFYVLMTVNFIFTTILFGYYMLKEWPQVVRYNQPIAESFVIGEYLFLMSWGIFGVATVRLRSLWGIHSYMFGVGSVLLVCCSN